MSQPAWISFIAVLSTLSACADGKGGLPGELSQEIGGGQADTTHLAVGDITSASHAKCTATLIGRYTVLTAAHCVTDKAPYGHTMLPITFYDRRGRSFAVDTAVVPPVFTTEFVQRDIAVLHLKQKVTGIVPARLSQREPKEGEAITLVGRGFTGPDGKSGTMMMGKNTIKALSSHFYSFTNATGDGICTGDSGGPAFGVRGGQEQVIGVHSASLSKACGSSDGVGYDTRVDVHLAWIKDNAHGDLYTGEPIDKTPPQVSIISPENDARVMRDLTVDVNVSDDSKIVTVSLELDGVKQAELVAPPFAFGIHHLKTGSHTLVAKAQDDEDNEGMATVKVFVPAPGDVGAACAGDDDCQSQRCVDSVCARTCTSTQTCPDGYHCDDQVCIEETGGCNVGSSDAEIPSPLMPILLGIALVAVRRSA